MARVRLLHWNAEEAAKYLTLLRSLGHEADHEEKFRSSMLRAWRQSPPDVFVIDLSKLPSHGREIAVELRHHAATRHIPIVFAEGAEDKVEAIRKLFPDAYFTKFGRLPPILKKALAKPLLNPVTPLRMMDRYALRTTAQKLGIMESSRILLIEPPGNYVSVLGKLPEKVEFVEDGEAQVTLCFLHEPETIAETLSAMRRIAGRTKLWVLWRKKTSKLHKGITEPLVREIAIDLGLVDYKVCSVDADWSGLAFGLRKSK